MSREKSFKYLDLICCMASSDPFVVHPQREKFFRIFYLFRAQEPKAPVTYCDHALPGVRPSVVRRPLDNLHFQLLLQNRLIDFDETWYE